MVKAIGGAMRVASTQSAICRPPRKRARDSA
jgi:hypothetical protein